jgi:signal transduction histidine kinase
MSRSRSNVIQPHWVDRFLPAAAPDGREIGTVLKLRLALVVALTLATVGIAFVLLNIAVSRWVSGVLPCTASVVIAASVPFRIRRGAAPERCTSQMLVGLVVVVVFLCAGLGGVYAPTIPWLAIFPYIGHALAGRRGGLMVGVVAVVGLGLLVLGSVANLFPPAPLLDEMPLIMVAVSPLCMGLTLALVSWASSGIQLAVERDLQQANVGLSMEIGEHERTQTRLEDAHREIVDVARLAGAAEVAIGILHNLGNALNAVRVSAGLADGEAGGMRIERLEQVAGLLKSWGREKETRYVRALARDFGGRRDRLRLELGSLREAVDHASAIVATQQRHAVRTSVSERVSIQALLLDAAALSRTSSPTTAEVVVVADAPDVFVDRHRLLQIVTNLLSNAQDALENRRAGKVLVTAALLDATLQIRVLDNGVGIEAHNLNKIFIHGFTTKANGHGFGLHASALAASELGGSLQVESGGLGLGTTFALEIPVHLVSVLMAVS